MYKRIAALLLTVGLLLSGVSFGAEASEPDEIRAALDALLIGVRYPTEDAQSATSEWNNNTIWDTIFGKMLWDDYLYSEESYLSKAGLQPLPSENRYLHFTLDDIQRLTREAFGRDFPTNINKKHMFVSNGELVIARATGEMTQLLVQDYAEDGESVTAIGIAVQRFSAYTEFLGFFEATFIQAPETIYGYTLTSLRDIEGNQSFDHLMVEASSEMRGITATYYAENAIDGDPDTFWAEGVRGVGTDEWLRFAAPEGERLYAYAISFSMGERKDGELVQEKSRPCKVAIEFENADRMEMELSMPDDVIVLQEPAAAGWVKITVLDAIEGSLYDATCISEIRLLGLDVEAYFPDREPEPTELETEPTQEPTVTEEVVTTEAPQTLPTESATEAPAKSTQAPTQEPQNDLASGIDFWIWGMLAIIVFGGAICGVVLILLLKKKGSL